MRRPPSSVPVARLGACAALWLPATVRATQTPPASLPATRAAARDTAPPRRAAPPRSGGVAGQIVDAATGEPLAGALVVLVPQSEGVLGPAGASAGGSAALARQAQTDASGRYAFGALAPGAYRIRASRLGYAPATADVAVGDAAPELSLGLAVAPLALHPVEVRGAARGPRRALAGSGAGARDLDVARRLDALEARRRTYLTTDAREVTRADVAEAATLAESDLFRALHRLPGVSTRDDWSADLWVRGARPDQTRVTLDGLPLFGPVAAFGAFTAVNADAVGGATLLPGVRPAAVGEGGAAVLELRTRAGGRLGGRATPGVGGVGEVGVASARVMLDGGAVDGRAAWAVAGRRSYVDALGRVFGVSSGQLPSFGDLTARGDLRLSPTQTLAASGLLQHTAASTHAVGLTRTGQGAAWGNRVLRLTHGALVGGLRVTHTAGVSAYAFGGRGAPEAAVARAGQPAVGASALLVRGEVAPAPRVAPNAAPAGTPNALPAAASAAAPTWSAGYELARQRAHYAGAGRHFFLGAWDEAGDRLARGDGTTAHGDSVTAGGALTVGALWATRRWHPAPRVEVEPGLRLELAGGAGAPAAVRPAPRFAARFAPDPDTRLSAAVGRAVQYTQALPPVGLDNAARFYPGALWLVAGRDAPALVTDLATLGAERWVGAGWLGSVNAYVRRTRGLATQDPAPGLVAERALYVVGRERGRGLELSARRLVGRTTASVAYSWSASRVEAGGLGYASPQDRPHVLDLTLARRLGAHWRVGGAFSAATGTPYTRTVALGFIPDSVPTGPSALPAIPATDGRVRDVPNARRNPAFLGLDLMAEWTRPVGAWHLGAFAQLHSPLAQVISDAYRGGEACYVRPGTAPGAVFAPGARCSVWGASQHETIPPVLPAVGLRVAF